MSQTGFINLGIVFAVCMVLTGCAADKDSKNVSKPESSAATTVSEEANHPSDAEASRDESDETFIVAKVVQSLHALGPNTTYLQLEADNKQFWVASSKVSTQSGDTVRYAVDQSIRMDNFNSKALNRTFDTILFLPEVEIVASAKSEKTDSNKTKK